MYCQNCNKNVSNEYVLCPDCGTPLKAMPGEENSGSRPTLDSIFQNNSNINRNVSPPPNNLENKWMTYLILSIVSFLCCNQISGIIGIIFACMANNDYTNGKYEDYEQKLKVAKWALIIGAILAAVIVVFVFAVNVLGFVASVNY